MPRKPKPVSSQERGMPRINLTLDPATFAALEDVQATHPEVESMSAAVRFLARQWMARKKPRKNPG